MHFAFTNFCDRVKKSRARRKASSCSENFVAAECGDQHAASVRSPIPNARLSYEAQVHSGSEIATKMDLVDQDSRRAAAQLEKYRRRVATRCLYVCNWSVRFRQIHSDSRRALPESTAGQGTILRSRTGRMQIDHRHAPNRRCGNGGSVTACSHPAFNTDSLSRSV